MLSLVLKLKHIQTKTTNKYIVPDLNRFVFNYFGIQEFLRFANIPKSKFFFQTHDFMCCFLRYPGVYDFLLGNQPIVASINVLHLCFHLFLRTNEQGFFTSIIWMVWQNHSLPV